MKTCLLLVQILRLYPSFVPYYCFNMSKVEGKLPPINEVPFLFCHCLISLSAYCTVPTKTCHSYQEKCRRSICYICQRVLMILKGYLAHKYMALDLLCFSLNLYIGNVLKMIFFRNIGISPSQSICHICQKVLMI